MKDSKNLLLILVSAGLTLTWVYHLYDKAHYSSHQFEVLVKDSLATQEAIKDSLQKLFNEKTHELDTTRMATDSLKGSLDSTRIKIYDLRKQISDILKNRIVTKADLRKARDLIAEYKDKIEEIKAQNNDLETERQRLSGELTQLNDEMKGLQENMQKITQENKELTETINQASTFIASDLHLSAVTTHSGDKEVEASSAKRAEKFVFSFTIQNNIVKNSFYDVYVVITQPGNKVLQNDVWGADYFVSKTEGNKPYTTKIHFEYTRGEKKKILFTLQPDNFIPGTYMMQVYQNGISLGETTKALN